MKATLLDRRHRREALTGGDQPGLVRAPNLEEGLSGPAPGASTPLDKAWAEGTATSDSRLEKIGGWYPKLPSNGDRPVPDTGNELCAYSTHESCWLQEDGF